MHDGIAIEREMVSKITLQEAVDQVEGRCIVSAGNKMGEKTVVLYRMTIWKPSKCFISLKRLDKLKGSYNRF